MGQLLKIYIGERDHFRGEPLYHAIVIRARQMGLAGATVYRGLEGFGAHSRIHTANILRLSEDLPVIIEIVDSPERIAGFIPALDEMVREGVVFTVDNVKILKYQKAPRGTNPSGTRST
ncbi:MAG: DUF190 domain-containing protein [Firmicutes bacterium]|nr:DUF190 domain-containing protein [Bacillota bacterium]